MPPTFVALLLLATLLLKLGLNGRFVSGRIIVCWVLVLLIVVWFLRGIELGLITFHSKTLSDISYDYSMYYLFLVSFVYY